MKRYQVFFGGTFDPPHLGHHVMLSALLRDEASERVHLVPTSQNPLKESIKSSIAERESWIKAWMEVLARELPPVDFAKLVLERQELDREWISYTADTLERLQARDGGSWVMALGSDSLASLDRWKDVEELLGRLEAVWVFSRGVEEKPLSRVPEALQPRTQWRLMLDDVPAVSSTEIRAGGDLEGKLLPEIEKLFRAARERA